MEPETTWARSSTRFVLDLGPDPVLPEPAPSFEPVRDVVRGESGNNVALSCRLTSDFRILNRRGKDPQTSAAACPHRRRAPSVVILPRAAKFLVALFGCGSRHVDTSSAANVSLSLSLSLSLSVSLSLSLSHMPSDVIASARSGPSCGGVRFTCTCSWTCAQELILVFTTLMIVSLLVSGCFHNK